MFRLHTKHDLVELLKKLGQDGYRWFSDTSCDKFIPCREFPIIIYTDDSDMTITYGYSEDDILGVDAEDFFAEPNFKWTKKPIEIEAFQWTGDVNQLGEPEWIVEAMHQDLVNITHDDYGNPILLIPTLEGEMMAKQGDYIIKGIKGELYPCDEEIFLATYER